MSIFTWKLKIICTVVIHSRALFMHAYMIFIYTWYYHTFTGACPGSAQFKYHSSCYSVILDELTFNETRSKFVKYKIKSDNKNECFAAALRLWLHMFPDASFQVEIWLGLTARNCMKSHGKHWNLLVDFSGLDWWEIRKVHSTLNNSLTLMTPA